MLDCVVVFFWSLGFSDICVATCAGFRCCPGFCIVFSPHLCVGSYFHSVSRLRLLLLLRRLRLPLCHTHLCHTPSVTHIFVNHHLSLHIFVTRHLSPTIFHTHLCQHTIFHTHLCFTHNLSHTSLSPTIFHTHLCHTLSFTHIFVNHHLSHTSLSTHHLSHTSLSTHHLSHTHFVTLSTTICPPASHAFCVARMAYMALG